MRNPLAQRAVRHWSCVALLTWGALGHSAWAQVPAPAPTATPPAGTPAPTPGAAGGPAADAPPAGPVLRPETPDAPPDPDELKLRPDEQGRIRFNFQGQPWVSVVTWLAEISDLSLDWQELPPGFLNLHTQQSYSIEEARDLINRHLLDRGFTLLKHGEILSVVRITKVDPSLVPRLEPDELAEARPHDFVRVTFPLDWITAESAVEDLKALISPNGKLTTIKAANQLEAMDAVANLRDIRRLVADPESPRGPRRLVRQFRLEHIKATECQPQLQKLLGLERQSSGGGSDPATMFQQMATFMKQAGIQPGDVKVGRPQTPQVHLVANPRDNSIVVNAPAEQMAIITEAIKVLDVPQDPSRSVLRNGSRVQTFPLKTLQPESAIKLLQELADLDPDTRLQGDTKTRSIIAHANLADQLTIRTLLEKLDGETRAFRVLPLKKLNAESVAFSLNLVMGGGEIAKRQSSRDAEDETRRFRVVADDENRLLLWVTEDELADVQRLLVELGETDDQPGVVPETVKVLDPLDDAQTAALLRRLQQSVPGLTAGQIEVAPSARSTPPAEVTPQSEKRPVPQRARTVPPSAQLPAPQANPTATPPARGKPPVRLTRLNPEPAEASADPQVSEGRVADAASEQLPGEATAQGDTANSENTPAPATAEVTPAASASAVAQAEEPASTPAEPKLKLERNAEGKLVVTSSDPALAELVQKLSAEQFAEGQGLKLFRMQNRNTYVTGVAEKLTQFFDERKKIEERRLTEKPVGKWYDPAVGRWIDSPRGDAAKTRPVRPAPKLITDEDSGSILLIDAAPDQVKMAEELIALYDTPEAQETPVVRVTRLVQVQHGQVRPIADTLRDVYRDLLSSSDAASSSSTSGRRKKLLDPLYSLLNSRGEQVGTPPVKYRGQLAIGIDEYSSSIVISAPEELANSVAETVEALDQAALATRPRVQIYKMRKGVETSEVQRKLLQALNAKIK